MTEEIEGFHLSPRLPPSRRYSRRSGEDNGRRRGNMCHGSVAIAVRIILEAVSRRTGKNEYAGRCNWFNGFFQLFTVKIQLFLLYKNGRFILETFLPEKVKCARKMVMNRKPAKNKQKTTHRAMDAIVNVRQKGSTRRN